MCNKDLSQETLEKLYEFNKKLHIHQEKILKEVIQLDKELIKRVEDINDPLDDYEIEANIYFYLKEDDPKFVEDEDNILISLSEYFKGISTEDIKKEHRWSSNHNEFKGRVNHPMKFEQHCWWYHCLYDHTDLEWEDILRIGTIWTDIKVMYQYFEGRLDKELKIQEKV